MSLTDSNGGLSAADVAAVTGNNGGFGFGNSDGAWWLLILFLFAFGGWNNNGFGAGNGGAINADVQRGFDQTAVMSGINGINNALVGGFADASIAQCNQSMNFLTALNGMQMQNNANSVITVPVTNDTEVQNYLVGAGNTVIFVDFDHGKLWIKSTASNGVPMQLRKFKLSEEIQEQPAVVAPSPTEQYATKADFDELKKMIEDLLK